MPSGNFPPTNQIGLITDIDGGGGSLVFPYFPIDPTVSKEVQWGEEQIVGRSDPVYGYYGSASRAIDLSIWLLAQTDVQAEVYNPMKFLQSFVYPDYTGQITKPPHRAIVQLGGWFKAVMIARNWKAEVDAPYTNVSAAFPYKVRCSMTWIECAITPWGFSDILAHADDQ